MSLNDPTHCAPVGDDSRPQLNLQDVFAHPAGLRTARFIVKSFVRASQNADQQHCTFSSVSPPTFDSSPEVASLLSEILAFSDSETRELAVGSGSFSPNGNGNVMTNALRPQYLFPEPCQQQASLSNPFASRQLSNRSSPNTLPARSTISYTSQNVQPILSHTFSNMESTSGLRSLGSHLPGTESPLDVESPSGRSSSYTPQPMSRQSSSRYSDRSDSALPETDGAQFNQTSYFSSAYSVPAHKPGQSNASSFRAPAQPFHCPPAQSHHKPSTGNQSRLQPKLNPQIKAFLPVNKANQSSHTTKQNSLPVDRTMASSTSSDVVSPRPQTQIALLPTPSPPLISPRPQVEEPFFRSVGDMVMAPNTGKQVTKKRKPKGEGPPRKRQKSDKPPRAKRPPKEKPVKPEPAKYRLSVDLWMRILEFTPPYFLKKVRLINKEFKSWVDKFDSIYVNQRIENYGIDMPIAPIGLTQRQYTDLLGGKGCLEPDCPDKKASRTHWSWAKRWCTDCWRQKIEREDKILKARLHEFPNRIILPKLLECIPIGMHDSFMKAHDYIENLESRPSTAPRIYKYYLKEEVDKVIEEYEVMNVPPFKDDPTKSAAENASARTAHQELETKKAEEQATFLEERKAKNDEHMQKVLKIEGAIRKKRQEDSLPYNDNRKSRRDLFLKRAREDIPDVPEKFILTTKAFKAATRIFRDGGTERGWQTLKPKIQKEWDEKPEQQPEPVAVRIPQFDGADDSIDDEPQEDDSMDDATQAAIIQNMVPAMIQQRMLQQHQFQQYMTQRANNVLSSGNLFANANINTYNGSSMQVRQPSYSNTLLGNTSLFDGLPDGQFQSQSGNFNQQSQMSMEFGNSYQNSYMGVPHIPNDNHGLYSQPPAVQQPREYPKIPVSYLLTGGPAPNAAANFDGFQ